jgi:uncharacterized protein
MKVVVDSNVYISVLVFGGTPSITMYWLLRNGHIIYCQEIITELRRTISAKFPNFMGELATLEKLLSRDATKITIGHQTITASRDPDDNIIIEAALASDSAYIITGDKDLLVLHSYAKINIITPSSFYLQNCISNRKQIPPLPNHSHRHFFSLHPMLLF